MIDVVHERMGPRLRLDEAEVLLHLETKGPDHCDEVLGPLRDDGYKLVLRLSRGRPFAEPYGSARRPPGRRAGPA